MKSKLYQKRYQILQIGIMPLGVLFYVFAGEKWISMEDDSQFYLRLTRQEGVMPIYPVFLFLLRISFREEIYLSIAVIIQSVLAIICTMIFSLFLQKQFRLKWWEDILIYLACMLPFSIYLPESGITHQIMTEGIAYALFYIYFLFLLKYVLDNKMKWCIATYAMAVFMSLIRSQLMFLLIVTMLIVCIMGIVKGKNLAVCKKMGKLIIRVLGNVVVVLCLVVLISKSQRVLSVYNLTYFFPEEWERIIEIDAQKEEKIVESETANKVEEDEEMNEIIRKNASNIGKSSQFLSLLLIRGLYEADAEDIEMFDDAATKELFQRAFQAIDEKQYRYVYARQDLYIWKDLMCDKIPNETYQVYLEYLKENPNTNVQYVPTMFNIGLRTLLKHMDRYLHHTMRMMIPGFISSVFFQIEKIYLLCHIITLGLYLFAIFGSIICARRGGNKEVGAVMGVTLLFLFVMVIVVNVMFFGLQRYMVYAMGIFYCNMYLLVRENFYIFVLPKNIKIL